jgi:hypothetical protein
MGSVTEGKNADLVLLAADPLAGVQNLKAIHGVVRGGKYYSAGALDDLKKKKRSNDTPRLPSGRPGDHKTVSLDRFWFLVDSRRRR